MTTVKETMEQTKKVLDEMHSYADDALGDGVQYLTGHFPRGKIERDGLLQALGNKQTPMFKAALKAEAKKLEKSVNDLTEAEQDAVFTKLFERPARGSAVGGFNSGKKRILETLNDDILQFYPDNASDALANYINQTINRVEKYKFFNGVKSKAGGKKNSDISKSIGALTRKLQAEGEFTGDADELTKIINMRFDVGEKPPTRVCKYYGRLPVAFFLAILFLLLFNLQISLPISTDLEVMEEKQYLKLFLEKMYKM